MAEFQLRGLGVAMVTPFKKDKEVDYKALERLTDYLIAGHADYLVVMGTTGEAATLFEEEKIKIIETVKGISQGRVPLVLGLGGNNTMAVVSEFQKNLFDGFSAILSVVPYYNKPSQEGIYQHFKTLSDNSPLPIIVYNIPSRSGVNMTSATVLRLARTCPNIKGVKESSGNMPQIVEILSNKPDNFEVISGDDNLTYPLMSMGATGVISVIGNAFPKEFSRMVKLCLENEFKEALAIDKKLNELMHLLFVDGNPSGIKCLLHEMGLMENELRLPLTPVKDHTSERIRNVLTDLQSSLSE